MVRRYALIISAALLVAASGLAMPGCAAKRLSEISIPRPPQLNAQSQAEPDEGTVTPLPHLGLEHSFDIPDFSTLASTAPAAEKSDNGDDRDKADFTSVTDAFVEPPAAVAPPKDAAPAAVQTPAPSPSAEVSPSAETVPPQQKPPDTTAVIADDPPAGQDSTPTPAPTAAPSPKPTPTPAPTPAPASKDKEYTAKTTDDSSNAGVIWNILIQEFKNPYAAAGILGNIEAESSCLPYCVEGDVSAGHSFSKTYTEQTDRGEISRDAFANSPPGGKYGYGYGLCQWTMERKGNLLDYAIECGASVGSISVQCAFLFQELRSDYPELLEYLMTCTDAAEACTRFCTDFERAAVWGSRVSYAGTYLEKYAG